jgi:hypothetical protein
MHLNFNRIYWLTIDVFSLVAINWCHESMATICGTMIRHYLYANAYVDSDVIFDLVMKVLVFD